MVSMCYFSSENSSQLLEQFHSLWQEKGLCDVLIETKDGFSLLAHRLVLSAASPYFRAMFTGNMSESKQFKVHMDGVDGRSLESILKFMYTSTLVVDSDNAEALLSTSNLLQLVEVKRVCVEFLLEQIHPSNCLGILSIADRFSCDKLLNEAEKFVLKNFSEVIMYDEFLSLSLTFVTKIFSNENLHVKSEEQVFEAAMMWLKVDKVRNQFLSEILQFVRLPTLSPNYLQEHVISNDILSSSVDCKDMLLEAWLYATSPPEEKRKHSHKERMQPRLSTGFADVLIAVGGLYSRNAVSSVEQFGVYHDKWTNLSSMATCRYGSAVTHLGGMVYCLGGYNRGAFLSTVECYQPDKDIWTYKASMNKARKYFGASCLFGKIYSVGGASGHSKLSSVECYSVDDDNWNLVSSMNECRMYVGVASAGGFVYAVGGHNGMKRLESVECYDPWTDTWSNAAPLDKPRSVAGVATLDGILYVAGGFHNTVYLSSVLRYDPRTDSWDEVAPLTTPRSAACVVAMKEKLYCLGGFNGQFLDSVEVYDPKINKWIPGVSMSIPRVHFGVAVV